ncbi:MAG TPA: hypothetical protein VLJ60_02790 [bacterium]|nr:hypothetical protein [bacterium]
MKIYTIFFVFTVLITAVSCKSNNENFKENEKEDYAKLFFGHISEKNCAENFYEGRHLTLDEIAKILAEKEKFKEIMEFSSYDLDISKFESWDKFMLQHCWDWRMREDRDKVFPECKKSWENKFECLKNQYSNRPFWLIRGEKNFAKENTDIIREKPMLSVFIDGITGRIIYE